MIKHENGYIYESPDGGHTVYRRLIGAPLDQRQLHSISDSKQAFDAKMERRGRWFQIVDSAEQDPVLRHMLDQIEIYHKLKSQP